jgi:hypothetical protein
MKKLGAAAAIGGVGVYGNINEQRSWKDMDNRLRVTIFNEFIHERDNEKVKTVYPNGIHQAISAGFAGDYVITVATQDMPEHGLTNEVLANTDVLLWWGHKGHKKVADEIVERVHTRVLHGMGLIVLHSGHYSKIFKKLMGTTCNLKFREAGEKERLWVVSPGHPIVEGIGECMASISTFRSRTNWCWSAGLRVGKCSAADAAIRADKGKFFISGPVMKNILRTITRMCAVSSTMRCSGRHRLHGLIRNTEKRLRRNKSALQWRNLPNKR